MGFLRLLLAIAVIVSHTKCLFLGMPFTGGVVAVEAFFIISGFYMALILNEKYVGLVSYSLFISNRILRLYPVYLVILVGISLISLLSYIALREPLALKELIAHGRLPGIGTLIYTSVINLCVMGMDTVFFWGVDPVSGVLVFTWDNTKALLPMHFFLIVSPAWTISLEMYFYFIAPFLVLLKKYWLFLLIMLLIGCKIWFHALGFTEDPFSYRFFPFELPFFLAGMLSYSLYGYIRQLNIPKWLLWCTLIYLLGFTIKFYHVPLPYFNYELRTWVYLGSLVAGIPFVFLISKDWKLDRELGEYSYPVYLTHSFVILLLHVQFANHPYFAAIVTFVSLIISFILIRYFIRPIEKYRQGRVRQSNSGK